MSAVFVIVSEFESNLVAGIISGVVSGLMSSMVVALIFERRAAKKDAETQASLKAHFASQNQTMSDLLQDYLKVISRQIALTNVNEDGTPKTEANYRDGRPVGIAFNDVAAVVAVGSPRLTE